ncbi:MAG: winged helix-turn-helix transcriptional regulator [Promethearchaeota archaeon]
MVKEKNEKELLEKIYNSIEEFKRLFILINIKNLEEIKKLRLKEKSIKKTIYDLCDGKRTNEDIANEIQKDVNYVNAYLSKLKREGYIKRTNDKEIIYDKIF